MISIRRIVQVAAVGLLVAAVLKELFQPRGLRVGQGSIFGVPYSFRIPQISDLQQRYWNADGAVLGPPLFGIGVVPNIPAALRRLGLWHQE